MKIFKYLVKLYIIFFKVGLFTIGGGYAMLPIVERELVEEANLSTMDSVMESYSLAQTLPGVIASNAAALIGYKLFGIPGAIASSLGVITPSIGIITVIAMVFRKFGHLEGVQNAFIGIRIVVLALLFDSFMRLFKVAVFDKKTFAVAMVSFVLVLMNWASPILILIIGALFGLYVYRERVGS
ncbi:MAG: chromate transporter [Clostridia bacterium]|nr:chromate transporter [Clostridia bacterium]